MIPSAREECRQCNAHDTKTHTSNSILRPPRQPPHPLQRRPTLAIRRTSPTTRTRITLPPLRHNRIALPSPPDIVDRRRGRLPLLGQFLVEGEDAAVFGGGVVHVADAAAAGGVVVGCGWRAAAGEGGGFDGCGGEGEVAGAAAAEGHTGGVGGGGFVEGVGHWVWFGGVWW